MVTETTIAGTRARLAEARLKGARLALVPTMGALHDGHTTLIDEARKVADIVAVSIFVNPLQFGPNEDFARYPRTLESDAARLAEHGASLLFAPSAEEMYGVGTHTTVTPPAFADSFEGAVRPGHFAGVLTVVAKLFNIVQPDVALFGRKDLQQLALVRAMTADLNFPIDILGVETVRESDGLALSSRNRYLNEPSRRSAVLLRAALVASKKLFASGEADPAAIEAIGRSVLAKDHSLDVDYFALISPTNFDRPTVATDGDSIVTAVRIDGTRLIDNIQL